MATDAIVAAFVSSRTAAMATGVREGSISAHFQFSSDTPRGDVLLAIAVDIVARLVARGVAPSDSHISWIVRRVATNVQESFPMSGDVNPIVELAAASAAAQGPRTPSSLPTPMLATHSSTSSTSPPAPWSDASSSTTAAIVTSATSSSAPASPPASDEATVSIVDAASSIPSSTSQALSNASTDVVLTEAVAPANLESATDAAATTEAAEAHSGPGPDPNFPTASGPAPAPALTVPNNGEPQRVWYSAPFTIVLSAPLFFAPTKGDLAQSCTLADLKREEEQLDADVQILLLLNRIFPTNLLPVVCSFLWDPKGPRPNGLAAQPGIKEWMRTVLVDWLVEVHWKWRLRPPVFFSTVAIIDRYLAVAPRPVRTAFFQLLGTAALFWAAKVEDETFDTDVSARSLAWLTDGAHSPEHVVQMEHHLATCCNFECPGGGAYRLYFHLMQVARSSQKIFFIGQCYLELSMHFYRLVRFSPSLLAASCCYLALWHEAGSKAAPGGKLEPIVWSSALRRATQRDGGQVHRCAEEIYIVARQPLRSQQGRYLVGIRDKYKIPEHFNATEQVWPVSAPTS
nr:G2/mitotic-specific cyclin-1 [Crypthecodinium cohnii]